MSPQPEAVTDEPTRSVARTGNAPRGGRQRLSINGKFLSAGPTGVHRTALQLVRALDAALERLPETERPETDLLLPRDARPLTDLARIRQRTVGRLTGQPWEQVSLPLAARGTLLLNFCNLGPLASRACLTMMHDAMFVTSPSSYTRAFRWKYRAMLPWLGRRHRAVLTVSQHSRAELAGAGICEPARCHVVHNGVEHVRAAGVDRAAATRLRLEPGRYAVALASTVERKNIGILLRAFAPGVGPAGVRLVLYGDACRADFEARGLTVPDPVVFAGRVSDAELAGLVGDALALCFPSTLEGFGLPPLEAMALGCPAVVAPCGALPEVCGEAVLYADPHDPAAWARALRDLARDAALREDLGRRGRAQAARFNWPDAAARVLAIARRVRAGAIDAVPEPVAVASAEPGPRP